MADESPRMLDIDAHVLRFCEAHYPGFSAAQGVVRAAYLEAARLGVEAGRNAQALAGLIGQRKAS